MAVKSLIQTVTVGAGGAASIEFTDIPQDGVDLVCLLSARLLVSNESGVYLRINGNTTTDYAFLKLLGQGSGTPLSSAVNYGGTTSLNLGALVGNNTANTFGSMSIRFSNYTSSANKAISVDAVTENNATLAYQQITAASFRGAGAITSLEFGIFSSYAEHTTASLYKIKYD
jgi:hypothetical protein